jgi:biopolymer transport protein TolR
MGMDLGNSNGAMADINVTPLVDVMLVLLIIFMITAPMLNQGVEIDLPKEDAQPLTADTEEQLILSIDRDLNYFINESEFEASDLPTKLRAIAVANPGRPVFVQADGSVPYREVARLLAAAKRAGLPRVGMVFEPGQLDEEEPEGSR